MREGKGRGKLPFTLPNHAAHSSEGTLLNMTHISAIQHGLVISSKQGKLVGKPVSGRKPRRPRYGRDSRIICHHVLDHARSLIGCQGVSMIKV